MNFSRAEIMPGVFLSHLHSDKFKTACFSLTLLTQLQRDTAAINALIPFVLRRGTTQYDDMEKLSRRMDELYGTAIEPVVRKVGELQCIGFYGSFPEPDYLPEHEPLLNQAAALMGQLLLSPATRGGLLLPQYVDSEKEKMADLIRSQINDKRFYAATRCIQEMCCYEDFSVGRFGSAEECESIGYKKLTKHYHSLLQTCPVELFYCGKSSPEQVIAAFKDALSAMPRGDINFDIGTDVRMNALEDHVRYVEEEMDVTQGKLVIGFRMGECMEEPDIAALNVFNCVYGSGTTSKLFMNVRERLSLCYYASSGVYNRKGIMLVQSGIEFDKYDEAKAEIFAQLDSIRAGEVSDEELQSARRCLASDLRSAMDSQGELEGFWLSQALDGLDYGPMELAALVEEVSRQDVIDIANSIECDLVYFLKGRGKETEDAEH